jgi:hypothetical protein
MPLAKYISTLLAMFWLTAAARTTGTSIARRTARDTTRKLLPKGHGSNRIGLSWRTSLLLEFI